MADDHAQEIARLEADIVAIQQTIAILAANPALREQLAAQLEQRQQQLALLQTGGNNLGVGNSIGDIIGRDKVQIERVVQIVQQIVLGEVAPAQLELIHRLIGPQPGLQWDLYQAIVAGLGRANVTVAVDAQGALKVVDDPAPERSPLDPRPFQELLLALRAAVLPADGALSAEERQARAVRYRELIIEQFRFLRLEGLSTGTKPIVLPLEQVYVHLRAVAEVPERADAFTPEERRLLKLLDEERADGRAGEAALREASLRLDALRRERWTRDRLERFPIAKALADPQQRGLVILGDPGSGKSTLLHFLALSFAEGPDVAAARLQVGGADADRLPIFAPLAAYDDMLNQTPELTIHAFLARYYDQRGAAPGLGPVFDAALAEGRALVLLDGLDEVIDERRRRCVAEQATRFVQDALPRGNRVVLTSRIYGYRAAPLAANLPHITVLDFRKEEITTFARQWFRAFQRWQAGGAGLPTQAELLAQAEERQLLDEIGRNPGVERLAVNPLLLTMLALLRQQIGTLPQRRITLYDEYVRALILRWEENRSRDARLHGSPVQIDLKEAEGALLRLALWLQQERPSGTATADDLLARLADFYLESDHGLLRGADPIPHEQERLAEERAARFLHDMRQHAGLLIERGQNAFGFRHLTFQEYFAGRALARLSPDERWALLAPNLHSGRWREPLLLCAAHLGVTESRDAQATDLVTRVLDAGSEYEPLLHRDLLLAADCAADDIGLAPQLLQRIADALWELVGAQVPKVQHAALERLHGLALLRAGGRARMPEVQVQLLEELLRRLAAGLYVYAQGRDQSAVQALELLTRLPLATDNELWNIMLERLADDDSDDDSDMRVAAVEALGGLAERDEAVRTALLERLADDYSDVRAAAVGALGRLVERDEAVRTALLERLADQKEWPKVWTAAVAALGKLAERDETVRTAVLERLADASSRVEAAAMAALGGLAERDGAVRTAQLERLADHDSDVREAVVRALGGLAERDRAVRTALLERLTDERELYDVRAAAVEALGGLAERDGAVRTAVLERLADHDSDVRAAAVRAAAVRVLGGLAERDGAVRAALLQTHVDWRTRQVFLQSAAVLLAAPQHQRHLLETLTNLMCQEADRAGVVAALGMLAEGNGAVRTALLEHLTDDDSFVRGAVVGALGGLAE
ncbi:MAG TPA: HEAT repeat domain-containing protein, partial [Roseiflexaceae bacterium]|nr:HEAT repeat domain-containing protein [Roseiflexaceae bacterium]